MDKIENLKEARGSKKLTVPDENILVYCSHCNKKEKYISKMSTICKICKISPIYFHCEGCTRPYRQVRTCKDHLLICPYVKKYRCYHCKFITFQRQEIIWHLHEKHSDIQDIFLEAEDEVLSMYNNIYI